MLRRRTFPVIFGIPLQLLVVVIQRWAPAEAFGRQKCIFCTRRVQLLSGVSALNSEPDSTPEISQFEPSTTTKRTVDRFLDDLVGALDLLPLMEAISRHAGTRRGRQGFLALANADYEESKQQLTTHKNTMSARSRRAWGEAGRMEAPKRIQESRYQNFCIRVARSVEEANKEYDLVAQALQILKENANTSYPPLYGVGSSPWDTNNIAETDYDSWLELAPVESTLEHILQAEKVIETIRKVKIWADCDCVKEYAPLISAIATNLDCDKLSAVYDDIVGTVIVKRVRTVMDPKGRSSFMFELNDEKFHVLQVLRAQVDETTEKLNSRNSPSRSLLVEEELSTIVERLEAAEEQIKSSLFQSILGRAKEINASLNILAHLDVIFAKAAFGLLTGGIIPIIDGNGKIDVNKFVHPVLLVSEIGEENRCVVPIDLKLSSEESHRALIISGPNGGGKTAAMKSFGLAAVLCKLGIPIPCRESDKNSLYQPQVDFFSDIYAALGDKQSLIDGESTMMARLNACAVVIDKVCAHKSPEVSSIVLLDELGGGTDPNAGGAIAQAILEKLLEFDTCIVATTHVPRLKVLSYRSKQFGCATVLMEPLVGGANGDQQYQQPSYELLYGSVGESYALEAASRCSPSLPTDVLARAHHLMTITTSSALSTDDDPSAVDDASYLQVLTESLKRQSERAREARLAAERYEQDSAACRKAILGVAAAYDRNFLLMQQKLEDIYQKLLQSETNTLDILGCTLSEIRLTRKEVKSQADQLKERGLKLLPDWYDLQAGETVVIVSEDEFMNGLSGQVLSPEDLTPDIGLKADDIAVLPSFSPWDDTYSSPMSSNEGVGEPMVSEKRPLILKRSQLAIWDYDCIWEEEDSTNGSSSAIQATSVKDSKRRLNEILLNLKSSSPSTTAKRRQPEEPSLSKQTFSSSRERKAAVKQNAKSKKKPRKN